MSFIVIAPADENLQGVIDQMDKATQEWTMRAARGECPWICGDCCSTFPKGMPDECGHGLQACTEIIRRDKAEAQGRGYLLPPDRGRCKGAP